MLLVLVGQEELGELDQSDLLCFVMRMFADGPAEDSLYDTSGNGSALMSGQIIRSDLQVVILVDLPEETVDNVKVLVAKVFTFYEKSEQLPEIAKIFVDIFLEFELFHRL